MDNSPWRTKDILLPTLPLAPWLRLAHFAGSDLPQRELHTAYVRTIPDFELVLITSGTGWIWSDEHGGSVDLNEGDVAFIPPGYRHGWANERGTHLAAHFDFHARPALAAMSHIRVTPKIVQRKPLGFTPKFVLKAEASEPIEIPLVTPLRDPALWREKFEPLALLYSRRVHHSLGAQLLAAESIGWAMRTLTADAWHAWGRSPNLTIRAF